jgi:glycosyltransferase involved in cell wall biosynthesis
MTPLRVLLWTPGKATALIPGGHVVQLEETARALAELGCEVTQSYDRHPSLSDIDIVHGLDLGTEQIKACHQHGLPVVVSTIYWDMDYRYNGRPVAPTLRSVAGRLRRSGRFALASLRGGTTLIDECRRELRYDLNQVAVFSAADLLLPNAIGEAQSVRNDLDVCTDYRVIPNGVDPSRFTPGEGRFEDRDTVLVVARIEPHKNQLGLLEVLRQTCRHVVIAGFPHRDHPDYVDRCREAADGWADVIVEPSTDTLVELYQAARVHVLPSWFETTGLVSLEAALCGCNVVSTDRGYAKEYLGELAWYCNPGEPDTIRAAVEQAWQSPPRPELRDKVLSSYTWKHVAEATVAAYQDALAMRSKS